MNQVLYHSLSMLQILLWFLDETKKDYDLAGEDSDESVKPRYQFLKKLWTEKEIKVISDLFELIEKDNKNTDCIIKTISCLLEDKDRLVQDYVNKLSTTLN